MCIGGSEARGPGDTRCDPWGKFSGRKRSDQGPE